MGSQRSTIKQFDTFSIFSSYQSHLILAVTAVPTHLIPERLDSSRRIVRHLRFSRAPSSNRIIRRTTTRHIIFRHGNKDQRRGRL